MPAILGFFGKLITWGTAAYIAWKAGEIIDPEPPTPSPLPAPVADVVYRLPRWLRNALITGGIMIAVFTLAARVLPAKITRKYIPKLPK